MKETAILQCLINSMEEKEHNMDLCFEEIKLLLIKLNYAADENERTYLVNIIEELINKAQGIYKV